MCCLWRRVLFIGWCAPGGSPPIPILPAREVCHLRDLELVACAAPLEWQEGDAHFRSSCALPFNSPDLDLLKGSKWGPFRLWQRAVNEASHPWLLFWALQVVLCVSLWKHPASPFSWDVLQPDLGNATCLSLRVKLCGQTFEGKKEKK